MRQIVTVISVVVALALIGAVPTSAQSVRQCGKTTLTGFGGVNAAPSPSSFAVITDSTDPDFFTIDNLEATVCAHWATICEDERVGLDPGDGRKAVAEALLSPGVSENMPGKP